MSDYEQHNDQNDLDLNTSSNISATTNKPIKIVLQSGHGNRIVVLAKRTTKISKLLNTFCKEKNVSAKQYRLIYKNKVLREDATVDCYNIQEDSVIEVAASQTGGM